MQRVATNYRDIRNRFRYILSNLYDFDPDSNCVAFKDMVALDQWILLRAAEVTERIRQWYSSFEFHRIYHQVNEFCTVDLSNFYFDVIKDRMYTAAPNSQARRSGQTALWRIGEALVRLVAPIMSFTADEIWSFLPKTSSRLESVHLAYFPKAEELTGNISGMAHLPGLRADVDSLRLVRDEVLKALEIARQEKLIGTGLEAMVTIHAPAEPYRLLERYRNDLRYLFIVSAVELKAAPEGNAGAPLRVEVSKASGTKCERCWNYSVHVGESRRYPTVCERCLAVLEELEQEPEPPARGEVGRKVEARS
jgi:isoleucyl-tRNA synthetase